MQPVVLDTDVASRLQRRTLPDGVEAALLGRTTLLTFVSVAEMLRGAFRAGWGPTRVRSLADWMVLSPQIDSDHDVAVTWARLVAERENTGRPIAQNDAWIAACCIVSGLPLATLNRKDFEGIEGLELLL